MQARVGTSGYSYKQWKGKFYPADLSNDKMLGYYARHFDTVEINNTFYRMPTAKLLAGWNEQVPDTFTFVLKATRRITHSGRLEPGKVEEAVAHLFEVSASLGDKLGPILFQLPPFFKKDLERLKGFLELLPKGKRATLEFRHASWFDEDVFEALRAHNVALCYADGALEDVVDLSSTADWGYLRLRQAAYDDEALGRWAERIRGQGWKEAFVFFKHEDEATGPHLAQRFIEEFEARGDDR